MLKISMQILALTLVLLLIAGLYFDQTIKRTLYQLSLFSGAEQHENFNRQSDFYPINEMRRSGKPFSFPKAKTQDLPASFSHKGTTVDTAQFISDTDTAALLILKDGKLTYENYWLTGGQDVKWLSHSVAKSFVSAAVGMAIKEGHIKNIEAPISDYVPMLKGSGYDGVSIKHVLEMSSGIRWTEDYSDSSSDINLFGRVMAMGSSYNKFVSQRIADTEPGTVHSYTGMDSQALAMLITEATGMPMADYMQKTLWQPLGMQDDAYWTTDNHGMELALGGLNASARDYLKLGELYRLGGKWNGVQILDADWIKASVTPDAPRLKPGKRDSSKHLMGYAYHWWVLEPGANGDEDYSAIGIYNQFIYVNPARNIVIVKLSAYRNYAQDRSEKSYREAETFELFRRIAVQ